MILFICGRPGGGKSLYAVMQLCRELAISERDIVTNLPLNLEALAEYCHREIEKPVDLHKRLRLLEEHQVREFFLYRPGFVVTARRHLRGDDGDVVPDFAEVQARGVGCLYIIDEAHLNFGAREWQKCGPWVSHFMSQHRKLGCDVMVITQHPEKVDKNFRRDCQDYTFIRNLGNERFFGGVTLKGRFRRSTYLEPPSRMGEKPMETGWFRLDVSRYGGLYDTSAGVGLSGRCDTHEEHRGRSPWMWGVVALGIIVLSLAVPRALGWVSGAMVGGLVHGTSSKFVQVMGGTNGGSVARSSAPVGGSVASVPGVGSVPGPGIGPGAFVGVARTNDLELVSVAWCGLAAKLCSWTFSDGRVVGVDSWGFEGGGPGWIKWEGKRYQYVHRVRGESGGLPVVPVEGKAVIVDGPRRPVRVVSGTAGVGSASPMPESYQRALNGL